MLWKKRRRGLFLYLTVSSAHHWSLDDDPLSLDDEPPSLEGNSLGASELLQPLFIRLNGGDIAWSVITPEDGLHVHCPGSGQAAAA